MNQTVTVAKAAGATATAITAVFQAWGKRRKPSSNEPTLVEPEQWPVKCRRAMIRFAEELRSHASESPIIFYTEFVDMWSIRLLNRLGKWPTG